MTIRRFRQDTDLPRLESYLRERLLDGPGTLSWPPERLHDLVTRVGAQEADEGRPRSADYIFLWEEAGAILACLLPDGENIYVSLRPGYEGLFPALLAFAEAHCLPLFPAAENAPRKFWVALSSRLEGAQRTLAEAGYQRYAEEEFLSFIRPAQAEDAPVTPEGFRFRYGEEWPDEEQKWSALRLGFHPEWEVPDFAAPMGPYRARRQSPLYADSFECLVTDERAAAVNPVCAYCFVWVDRASKSALIEPLAVREAYRRRGLGRALLRGAALRCRALGLEKCYVDSFGWRNDYYAAAGFVTEDRTRFWGKEMKNK